MPTSWTGLAIALLAVAPGFIMTTTWARARTWKGPSTDLRTILQSLALSGVVQVLLVPLTIAWVLPDRADPAHHAWPLAAWAILAVLVLPVCLGFGAARLQDWVFPPLAHWDYEPTGWRARVVQMFRSSPPPTVWDWAFTRRNLTARFLLLEFEDGSHVGGVFAAGSYALTSPETQGLFLSSEWQLDDNADFVEQIPASEGILIPSTAPVRWIRILGHDTSESNESRETTEPWRARIRPAKWWNRDRSRTAAGGSR